MALQFLDAVSKGDISAYKELGDRLDGKAQQEVMRLNAELEQRVHERTVQLEQANAELAAAMEEAKSTNQAKSEIGRAHV